MSEWEIGFSTKAVHAGEKPCPVTGANIPPIYQTTSFTLKGFLEGKTGYIYTRAGNPTNKVLEEKMAALEGCESALVTASGMAAILTVILTLAKRGDEIVSSNIIYGGTYNLLKNLIPELGIKVIFTNLKDIRNLKSTVTSKTKLILIETPANPTMELIDIKALCEEASKYNIPVAVDNTFMTPYYQRPLQLGAKIVIYSATKYLSGHGDTLGGIITGPEELLTQMRKILTVTGGIISPFNAWLIIRGLKTLPLRMDKHSKNAMEVAKFLSSHPKVEEVLYPGLPTHPQHNLAKKQMTGFGGMLSFKVKGGLKEAYTLLRNVKICRLAVSLGDTSTLIEHPATMTHHVFPEEEKVKLGITSNLIRLSVGIEDAEDIIRDLSQALEAV